jgi:hypothetical protein
VVKLWIQRIAVVALFGALGYGAWWLWENWVVIPTRLTGQYLRGERDYDPMDAVMQVPLKKDEAYICPGITLGGVGVGPKQIVREMKVKIVETFRNYPDSIGVKVYNGQNDVDSPYTPEYIAKGEDLKSAKGCK